MGDDVLCPAGAVPCLLTVKATARDRSGRRRKPKSVTVASASIALAPGATKAVTLKLNGKGRRLLRRLKRLRVKATITVRCGSHTVTEAHTIRIA